MSTTPVPFRSSVMLPEEGLRDVTAAMGASTLMAGTSTDREGYKLAPADGGPLPAHAGTTAVTGTTAPLAFTTRTV